jgi:multicomponent K+:H+ antiporter subunit D
MSLSDHLPVLPIVLPLLAGAVILVTNERRVAFKAVLSLVAIAALVASASALVVAAAAAPSPLVYRLGDWPSPFGIVLVVDRVSALLVLLTSILGFAAGMFSTARWHRAGPRFHALVQFLLMGVNGAFLTGDLFNLFVFFEVLLVASYGLALHGSGPGRVRASLHYIAINLVASLLFLIGASVIYGTTGTLNMADLSVRIAALSSDDRVLLEVGAAALAVAFFTKAGMWPLCLWLPGTYSAASPPAAALFAVLTKVGLYTVLRTWTLFFSDTAKWGEHFGGDVIMIGGLVTLAFGSIGVLASQNLPRVTAYSLLVSAGTLLAAIATDDAAVTGAALFYLVASTLGVSSIFLLSELLERGRAPGADSLAVTAEAYIDPQDELEPEEEVGFAIPGTMALLGGAFALSALVIAGLPPLAGFAGKFALLDAVLASGDSISPSSWALLALLMASGFTAVIAFGRSGVRRFWASDASPPPVSVLELAPVVLLLTLCAGLTVFAGAAMSYTTAAAEALHAPRAYVQAVLSPP